MSLENQPKSKFAESDNELQIIDLWHIFWANRYWFVFSVFICLSLAIIYIASVPNTYTRSASLMIKNTQRSGSSEMIVFQDIAGMNSSSNVYNEAATIKSPAMMEEVVKSLRLDVAYFTKKRLSELDLYDQSPIVAHFPDALEKESFTLQVEPLNKSKVRLSHFSSHSQQIESEPIMVSLNDTVMTPIGRVLIQPTLFYAHYKNKQIKVSKYNRLGIAKSYSNMLKATISDDKTSIINLSITNTSARRAEHILDTLVSVYNRVWIGDKNQAANSSIDFIDSRLSIILDELNEVELDKKQYKSDNRVINAQAVGTNVMGRLERLADHQLVLENDLLLAQYLKRFLKDQTKIKELLPAIPLEKLNISMQVNNYNDLLLKRDQLLANSSSESVIVRDLTTNLSAIRVAIEKSVDNIIQTTQMELTALLQQEKKADLLLAENPEQERQLFSFERDQSVKQQMYLYLMQKKYENELTKTVSVDNAKVISVAQGPNVPIAPKKSMILMLAGSIGLILPGVIIWLLLLLDTTVKGRKDLEGLSAPFIGEIPYWYQRAKKGLRRGKQQIESDETPALIVQEKSRDVVSEAFRMIRSNIDFIGDGDRSKIILLTSFNAGSGKTFITKNLAMSFALSNKKVVVIDLDLRKATLSKLVPSAKQGVSSYLSGKTDDFKSLIVRDFLHDNFDILPVGVIPPNPAELLLSGRLGLLFEELKQQYDYIFIDTTPAEIVADAAIVGKMAHITLFVVREGLLDKRMLPELERLYQSKKFGDMGIILNCSHYSSSYYGYRRSGYGYGYGYGEGYYSEDKKSANYAN